MRRIILVVALGLPAARAVAAPGGAPPPATSAEAAPPDGPPPPTRDTPGGAPPAGPPVPAEDVALAEALQHPDYTGRFVIEARDLSSGAADTCLGEASMVRREGRLDGLATCTFAGAMADFGTTKGRVTLVDEAGQAHFDASPSPVVANPEVRREADGLVLRFGDTLEVGDGHRVSYTARIELHPVESAD
ncbi:MAG: hypothetical protein D6798_04760 [Deltaproteobacteria bacterium]|nr:MAG: hypothetical protein D6798_04760 [Deltaproteobacteria bacterium]